MDEFNPLAGLFDLLGKKIESDAQIKQAQATWSQQDARYGVDEYGRVYLRGSPSTPALPFQVTPTVIVVGLLAVSLAVYALKS